MLLICLNIKIQNSLHEIHLIEIPSQHIHDSLKYYQRTPSRLLKQHDAILIHVLYFDQMPKRMGNLNSNFCMF